MRTSSRSVRDIILSAKLNSQAECKKVRDADPLTPELLHECLKSFMMHRYLLTPADCESDDLRELSDISLKKTAALSKELASLDRVSGGCIGADSVDAKIALLLFAIQRDFEITLPLEKAVYVRTLTELAEMMMTCLNNKKGIDRYDSTGNRS